MASKILPYYIGLTSKSQVEEFQAQRHNRYDGRVNTAPGLVFRAPIEVAVTYSAPISGWAEPKEGPATWSPFFEPAAGGSGGAFPTGVATFERKAGGFWGWLGFGKTRFYWAGQFRLLPGSDELPPDDDDPDDPDNPGEPLPPPKLPIQQRRWIEGFEAPDAGAGGSGNAASEYVCPDGSRHLGGYGLALRNAANKQFTKVANAFGLAGSASDWERLYVRVRKRPSGGSGQFWQCSFDQGSSPAVQMEIMPTGQIAIYVQQGIGTRALVGTTTNPLEIGRWYRLDMTYTTPPIGGTGVTATDGSFTLYIGGRQAFTGAISASIINHLVTTSVHISSTVGSNTSVNNLEIDLDDWICIAGLPTKATLDWRNGSAVVPLRPTAFGSGHNAAAWPGSIQVFAQRPTVQSGADQWSTSNTALSRFEVDTNSEEVIDGLPGSIGMAALIVGKFGTRGSTSGQLGYKIGAAAEVLTAVTEQVISGWVSAQFTISGPTEPLSPVGLIKLSHIKGNDASNGTVYSLMAQAECIGVFDQADADTVDFGQEVGLHNWPYPRSPWAVPGEQMPIAPVAIYHGAYVGNGTALAVGGQDIEFPVPIHWWWCRPVTGSATGSHWWSSMAGAHAGLDEGVKPAALSFAFIDAAFPPGATEDSQQTQSVVRLGGNNAQVNANGVTYQYVAVSDPGGRFMLNGAISHRHTVTETNELINQNFQALAAFFFNESYGGGGGGDDHRFKGPNNTSEGYSALGAAEIASAVSLGLGEVVTKTPFYGAWAQVAFNLWRNDDNSDDPGKYDVMGVTSYVGDGSASRTINFSPASTKSPLFAYVQSRSSVGMYRDPSHTTNNSNFASGAGSTVGIIGGGINSITVGSTLNQSGQFYSVFVIWGAANPGGWTPAPIPGDPPIEIIPVEPIEPPDDPGTPPPDEDPGTDPDEPTEPEPFEPGPGLEDDLAEGLCADNTIATMNLALSRVGISQHIDHPSTDQTLEAHLVSEHWNEAVLQTLRDFPWPFATKYATLTLLEGEADDPVNGDWTFAYRKPGDCVFERRLVVERAGAVDPAPPPFALGFDDEGGVIYTNEASAVLEYTARPACVAFQGDPLFRDAVAWKLAAMIGPPLSRMPEVSAAAAAAYVQAIANAERVIKPGNPGARAAAATVDVAEECVAANLTVANRALIRIGANTIANMTTEQSREAESMRAVFEEELRSTLRDFPWPFATEYATEPVLVAGTAAEGVNADWQYSYRLPTDYVFGRRLVTTLKRGYEPNPYPYRIGRDATGYLLFTDQEDPVLEYTARRECIVEQSDPLFRDALAWRLAATLAPSLAQVEPEAPEQAGRGPEPLTKAPTPSTAKAQMRDRMTRYAWGQYYVAIDKARVAAANEQQRDPDQGDAPWIRDRF